MNRLFLFSLMLAMLVLSALLPWGMTSGMLNAQSLVVESPCGDLDGDMYHNILDYSWLIDYMFNDGSAPIGEADMDECGSVNIGDAWYLMEYLFLGGPLPCEGSVTCSLPAGANSIDLGCQIEINDPIGDSVAIPVYITNDTPIYAISLGFKHNSPDIEITSVSFDGSVLNQGMTIGFSVDSTTNEVVIYWLHTFNSLFPQAGGLLATMWVQVPISTPSQIVDIYSTFIEPGTEFVFCPRGSGVISPAYNDCGTDDIVIINPQPTVCGDVNCDGSVNVGDAVYLINYVFKSGAEPCDPDDNGKADCF